MVRDAIAAFRANNAAALATAPLVAFGASSGGALVLMLPSLIPGIQAVVSQIMAIPPHMLPSSMPPTLFVHMHRDARTSALVQRCVKKLKQSGTPHAAALEVMPAKPTASFFMQRIERLTHESATALHAALKKAKLLDEEGHLAIDPRRSAWRDAVRGAGGGLHEQLPGPGAGGAPDTLVSDESAVSEALNVAYAMHEIVSDQIEVTLAWAAKPTSSVPGAPASPPLGDELRV